jgi:2-amino-4-hydroxy-6-hydroxymethyldihydropteridine diphosphokinase
LAAALEALRALPQSALRAVSSIWRSAPIDSSGPDYLNAVALIETRLAPRELLEALQRIESAHGRERPYRNAPRTLDLDLLLYGEQRSDDPGLSLPHPRLHLRAFVLKPLLEIAPQLQVDGLGALAPWLQRAGDQAVTRIANEESLR